MFEIFITYKDPASDCIQETSTDKFIMRLKNK